MKTLSLLGLVLVAAPMGALGQDAYLFVDESDRLPSDPGADTKDSLDIDVADVDGDGDLDVFLVEGSASLAGFQNILWINDGAGNLTDETALRLPAVANNSTEVDFADVDGDGDLDAVVSNLGPNQLLINDGSGAFADAPLPQATPPGPPGFGVPFPPFFIEVSAEAIFADVDGDGDPDILISNENPFPFGPPGDQNRVLINDGSGAFTDDTFARLPFAIDNTSGHVAGDIDGDGDQDLIVIEIGQNRALINNGLGFFADETAARLPALDDSSRKGALGDVDGDGDLDLLVGNSRGQQDRLYLNDGAGVFTDVTATHLPVDSSTTTDVDLHDFDSDGDLDAFVTNVGAFVFNHGFLGEPNLILSNDGTGRFTDISLGRLPQRDGRSTNAAIGDVTGDGVDDVLVANSGGVDQPGLPPPDGAERLLAGRDCTADQALCAGVAIDGLLDALAALTLEDMAEASAKQQAKRRDKLLQWAEQASTLAGMPGNGAAAQLQHILDRVDGLPNPPDWVAEPAASTIRAWVEFALATLG